MDDYNEKYASTIIKQVLLIIRDLHELDIVHQDMKPENLLLVDRDSNTIKLCDFGLAEIVTDDIELVGLAGSTPYMAPEVLDAGGHGKPVDIYATGVITYILLCGYPPFEPDNGIIYLEFPSPEWDTISSSAKDLIEKLLISDPNKRLTAEEALKHAWIKDVETLKENPLPVAKNTLRRFREISQTNIKSSMREFRGAGGGREHVKDIFNPPEPDMHEEKQTNGARRESLSESSVSSVETNIIHTLQKDLAKTREKMINMRKETTLLKILLAEQTAARLEIESKCKFELDLIKTEAEEERKKRKKVQAQLETLKNTTDILTSNKDPKEKKPPAKAAISPKKTKKI
jgi:serine/threonine protein kinase